MAASLSFACMGLALLVFATHLCGFAGREVRVAVGVEWSHVTAETILAWLARIMVRVTWSYLAAVGSTRCRNKGVPVRQTNAPSKE
jgi:hypothetical protein